MRKYEALQSHESRPRHVDSTKAYSKHRAFKSRRHWEEILANSALKKYLKCAEAQNKLLKLIEQEKRLKSKIGYIIHNPVAVVSSS